jgi:preprotein translocase subunit SecG
MTTVLLVIHILLALALIGVVLLQRSEGGGLGIGGGGGGGGGGMGGFLTGRGTANLLTRTTAILAAGFMVTSITLTLLAGGGEPRSIIDRLPGEASSPEAPAPEPAAPSEPSVPTQ